MNSNKIEKVIICGLGAVGLTYANKLKGVCNLKILVDNVRLKRFQQNPPILNGEKIDLEYVTPDESWIADLIIISTKASGLESAISYIKNFVGENTIIISLLNGIASEEKISSVYGQNKVVPAYFIGHSAVRDGNTVRQDGVGKIVLGDNKRLENFFKNNNIEYEIAEDITYSLWVKLGVNIFLNQPSTVLNFTMGDMKKNKNFKDFAKKLIHEVKQVAELSGVKNLENYEDEVFNSINLMSDEGKSSMLQDILAKRKTEVDIFAGEIIKRGKQYGIPTPYNQTLFDLIKILEENNEHSIHTC